MTEAPKREAAAPDKETATSNNSRTQEHTTSHPLLQGQKPRPVRQPTLGRSLFHDPLGGQSSLGDLRHRLELKYAACVATGGTNGFPLRVTRIKNEALRQLAAAGMLLKDWTVRDLIECSGLLELAADSVLIATLEKPRWGPEDFNLLGLIERIESMQSRAFGGGRML